MYDDDNDNDNGDDDDDDDALSDGCCKASSVKPTIVAALSHQGFGPWRLRYHTISDILQYHTYILCYKIVNNS